MALIKLTKTELRSQQLKLVQLQRYLPTLQLKKALLQLEVDQAEQEIEKIQKKYALLENTISHYSALFSDRGAAALFTGIKIQKVLLTVENIAGIDLPHYEGVHFAPADYALFDTPLWLERAMEELQKLLSLREEQKVAEERKKLLEKELREVSIRVNLFEKILIPRALENMKKIALFLGEQQLAAVAQAKISKRKILLAKKTG